MRFFQGEIFELSHFSNQMITFTIFNWNIVSYNSTDTGRFRLYVAWNWRNVKHLSFTRLLRYRELRNFSAKCMLLLFSNRRKLLILLIILLLIIEHDKFTLNFYLGNILCSGNNFINICPSLSSFQHKVKEKSSIIRNLRMYFVVSFVILFVCFLIWLSVL